jgi:hypothetical protein
MDNKDVYDRFITEDKFTASQIENFIHVYNTGEPYKEPKPKPVTKVRIGNRQ